MFACVAVVVDVVDVDVDADATVVFGVRLLSMSMVIEPNKMFG